MLSVTCFAQRGRSYSPMPDLASLRVCFLAGTLGRGGAERQLVYMLRALQGVGISTSVLCLTHGESFESEITKLGVPLKWVGARESPFLRLRRIVRALRDESVDILQSVHFYTNLYAGLAARLLRIESIGAIRSDLSSELKLNGVAGRAHLYCPRFLIANSALGRQRAIAAGVSQAKVFFISNAVGTNPSNGKRRSNGRDSMRIVFVGRLTPEKRPDRFLRVASKVIRGVPGQRVKALLVGDGPLRSDLEVLAGTLGLDANCLEFLGEQEDMDAVYEQADLLMLTSDWEGTPNVLLEAMSHGVAVAATRVGGVAEIVRDDCGLLAAPDDEEGLTAAALRLITDANLRSRLGRSGQDYVSRFHSLDALQAELLSTYQRILSQ